MARGMSASTAFLLVLVGWVGLSLAIAGVFSTGVKAVKQQQIQRPIRRPADQPIDTRTPSGRPLKY